jgi:hypothetical protein
MDVRNTWGNISTGWGMMNGFSSLANDAEKLPELNQWRGMMKRSKLVSYLENNFQIPPNPPF